MAGSSGLNASAAVSDNGDAAICVNPTKIHVGLNHLVGRSLDSDFDLLHAYARVDRFEPHRARLLRARIQTARVPPIRENGLSPMISTGNIRVRDRDQQSIRGLGLCFRRL